MVRMPMILNDKMQWNSNLEQVKWHNYAVKTHETTKHTHICKSNVNDIRLQKRILQEQGSCLKV